MADAINTLYENSNAIGSLSLVAIGSNGSSNLNYNDEINGSTNNKLIRTYHKKVS